jgi:hypothetical protein
MTAKVEFFRRELVAGGLIRGRVGKGLWGRFRGSIANLSTLYGLVGVHTHYKPICGFSFLQGGSLGYGKEGFPRDKNLISPVHLLSILTNQGRETDKTRHTD